MGNLLSEEQAQGSKVIAGSDLVGPSLEKLKKESRQTSEINQNKVNADSNPEITDTSNEQHTTGVKETDVEYIVDKYLNGKDCLSCKVIATVNPLLLAGFTFYSYRNTKLQHLKQIQRFAANGMFISMIGGFLTMSFMSLTGTYTVKSKAESWSEYLQRDRQTAVNQIRALYRPSPPQNVQALYTPPQQLEEKK